MRKQNWPELLDEYIRENSNKEFIWGKFDCVSFGASWVYLITEIDTLVNIEYSSQLSALKLLKRNEGLFNLTSIQMNKIVFKQINPKLAKRGDIVGFYNDKKEETVGICIGNKIVSPAENTLEYQNMIKAEIAWEVN